MARCTMAMLLLLAVLGSQASAHLRSVKQHQGASGRHLPFEVTNKTACDCLSFHEAYNDYQLECGWGGELEYWNGSSLLSPISTVPIELETGALVQYGPDWKSQPDFQKYACAELYKRIPDNFCVNNRWGYNAQQWCYVDTACEHASRLPGTRAGIKLCGQGHGEEVVFKPGNVSIETMQAVFWALQTGMAPTLTLDLLGRFAIKQWSKDAWPEIKDELFNKKGPSRSDLFEMMASFMPTLIGSDKDFSPPWFLVQGPTISKIDNWYNDTAKDDVGGGRPYMYFCVHNCGNNTRPLDFVEGVTPVTPEKQAEWASL